jgi:hypothetical protein
MHENGETQTGETEMKAIPLMIALASIGALCAIPCVAGDAQGALLIGGLLGLMLGWPVADIIVND